MKHSLLVGVIGSTALLVGCTEGGLSMRETGRNTQLSYLAAMYADVEPTTQPAAARRPFAGPARLAVAQVGEVSPPQAMIDRLAAVPAIFARIDSLPAVGDSRRMYRYGPVGEVEEPRRQVDALRRMAASVGADYLLLVGGTVDSSSESTPLSVLNLTIVGMFIVPSEQLRANMKASGALIDVRTAQVVSLSSAELSRSALVPYASSQAEGLRKLGQMRDQVTADLADKVVKSCAADAARAYASR